MALKSNLGRPPQIAWPTQIPWKPRIRDDLRIYVVGDIHGRADLLRQLSKLIDHDYKARPIAEAYTVFLGDYVDKGMETKAVIELLAVQPFPTPMIALCGNHEAMLLTFVEKHEHGWTWIQNGGLETLHSYGIDVSDLRFGRGLETAATRFRAILPTAHVNFLQSLSLAFTIGDYYFCHAGIRPGVPLNEQTEEDLLWIRYEFLTSNSYHGKVIVHGHTPVQEPEIMPNRINLDTGAYITGRLSCLVLEGATRQLVTVNATKSLSEGNLSLCSRL